MKLQEGRIGYVVENGSPDTVIVEFKDEQSGEAFAIVSVNVHDLLSLKRG
ncbi:hypothetical protein [Propionivibrio dicarboxylicus]|nr:hypothetical protein [Propionivibrio dicarboxylicus]